MKLYQLEGSFFRSSSHSKNYQPEYLLIILLQSTMRVCEDICVEWVDVNDSFDQLYKNGENYFSYYAKYILSIWTQVIKGKKVVGCSKADVAR
jgi:hypothetical protein